MGEGLPEAGRVGAVRRLTVGDLKAFIARCEAHPHTNGAGVPLPPVAEWLVHIMDMSPEDEDDESTCNIASRVEVDRFSDETGWVLSIIRDTKETT